MGIHSATTPKLRGYVSARLAVGLGVITKLGYHLVREDEIVVDGPHPTQWDRHEHQRTFGL